MHLTKRNSTESIYKLFKDYTVGKAIGLGLADASKYKMHANLDLDCIKSKLLDLCKVQTEQLKLIETTLFKNASLDLFIELSAICKSFYKDHFEKAEMAYRINLSQHILNVMIIIKSDNEADFLSYTDQDVIAQVNGTKRVSQFWTYRNYYIANKNSYPKLAYEILNSAKAEYSSYVNDMGIIENYNVKLSDVFVKLKTTPGKLHLINMIWHSVRVLGNNVDYSPILKYKDDLLGILVNCIEENNRLLFNNITLIFRALFFVKGHDSEVIEVRNKYLDILKGSISSQ